MPDFAPSSDRRGPPCHEWRRPRHPRGATGTARLATIASPVMMKMSRARAAAAALPPATRHLQCLQRQPHLQPGATARSSLRCLVCSSAATSPACSPSPLPTASAPWAPRHRSCECHWDSDPVVVALLRAGVLVPSLLPLTPSGRGRIHRLDALSAARRHEYNATEELLGTRHTRPDQPFPRPKVGRALVAALSPRPEPTRRHHPPRAGRLLQAARGVHRAD